MYQGCQSTAPFPIDQSTQAFPQLYHDQLQLGWKQLFYGQYFTLWSASCLSIHPHINSTHYYTKCLTLTWQAVLNIWNICNKNLLQQTPPKPTRHNSTQLSNKSFMMSSKIQPYRTFLLIQRQNPSGNG